MVKRNLDKLNSLTADEGYDWWLQWNSDDRMVTATLPELFTTRVVQKRVQSRCH
jgi:hypothetical protein